MFGGREGDRTPDLVVANDALSQLSYTPTALTILANTSARAKRLQSIVVRPRMPDKANSVRFVATAVAGEPGSPSAKAVLAARISVFNIETISIAEASTSSHPNQRQFPAAAKYPRALDTIAR
jgi:hypothetical protein